MNGYGSFFFSLSLSVNVSLSLFVSFRLLSGDWDPELAAGG